MPITQQRMLDVLHESERLAGWLAQLKDDADLVMSGPFPTETKIALLMEVLLREPPACVQTAIERDHFRRAAQRNVKSAKRMRSVRNKFNEAILNDNK